MSAGMEWVLCFGVGVALAWLTMKAFGLVRCVGLLAVWGLGASALAQDTLPTYNVQVVNNTLVQQSCQMYTDPVEAGHYNWQWKGFDGYNHAGPSYNIPPGGTWTFDPAPSNPVSQSGYWAMLSYPSMTSDAYEQPFVQWDCSETNKILQIEQARDGHFYWLPNGPVSGGGGGGESTNAPWVATGDPTKDGTIVTSNNFAGISTVHSNVANGTWVAGAAELKQFADLSAAQLSGLNSNSWKADGAALTNLAGEITTNAMDGSLWRIGGAAPGSSDSPNAYRMINFDPRQSDWYSGLSRWIQRVWKVLFVLTFVWLVKDWVDEVLVLVYMVPPQGALKSVGSLIQSFFASGIFVAAVAAIPLAVAYFVPTIVGMGEGDSFASLYQGDGSKVGRYVALAWGLFCDFFPVQAFIGGCLWLGAVRYLVLPGVRTTAFVLARLLTAWAVVAVLGASTVQAATNTSGPFVVRRPAHLVAVSPAPAPTGDVGPDAGLDCWFTVVNGVPGGVTLFSPTSGEGYFVGEGQTAKFLVRSSYGDWSLQDKSGGVVVLGGYGSGTHMTLQAVCGGVGLGLTGVQVLGVMQRPVFDYVDGAQAVVEGYALGWLALGTLASVRWGYRLLFQGLRGAEL